MRLSKWAPMPLGSISDISPVFIVGMGRSGTTPMQLALNMHPELGVYGETQALIVHRKFGMPSDAIELGRLCAYWHRVIADQTPHKELLLDRSLQGKLSSAPTYAQVMASILGEMATRDGKARWGEKTPAHIFRLDEIYACFPKAKVIHMIRDPRGAVCSGIQAFSNGEFTDHRVFQTAKYWRRVFRVHQSCAKLDSTRYMLVRHDDFVREPEAALRGVCNFLDVDFVPEMLTFHKTAANYIRKTKDGKLPTRHLQTQRPVDAARAEAWRAVLTPRHVRLIEAVVHREMQTVGYEPTGDRATLAARAELFCRSAWWKGSETRRLARKEARVVYWGLRRVFDSDESTLHPLPQRPKAA